MFFRRCVFLKRNRAWFYHLLLLDVEYAACWECVFNILKRKFYRKNVSTHTMMNDKSYNMNAQLSVIKSDEYEYTWQSIKAVNCLNGRDDFLMGIFHANMYILDHFCMGCISTLLRIIMVDLNKVTNGCIIPSEKKTK